MKKQLLITLGFLFLGLGALGTLLPILPCFPFLLLSSVCFGKSSDRLYNWFTNTKLYKQNLESIVQGKGMTKKAKIRVVSVISLTMAFGFLMMKNVPSARILLLIVWLFHVFYMFFGIKTCGSFRQ